MERNKHFTNVWFYVGLLLPLPLLAFIDHTLVRQFGRAYWSLPRELGLFAGWPLITLAVWLWLRRTSAGAFVLGMLVSGVLVVVGIAAYLGLFIVGYLGTVLFH